MIDIKITPADFEYDVQSLVQAFFPGEKFQVNKELSTGNSSDTGAVSCEVRQLIVTLEKEQILFEYTEGEQHKATSVECLFSDRRQTKNILKKALYELLSEVTGKKLPWGNLTGIRPAKIPALMLKEGKNEEEIKKIMTETYMLSDDKLNLAMDVAKRENDVLKSIDYENGYSLYIGVPFCPTTCLYCSFTSYPISIYQNITDKYVDSVIKEMEYVGERFKKKTINSIYIGGGTPTTLSAQQLKRIIQNLKSNFDFGTVSEFTVEAGRPDSITEEKLVALKENGVERISINPQTMNQKTLDLIGRKHTVNQVVEKFNLARKIGFDNINMDLIMGLPQEEESDVENTLKQIEILNPDSLTVHSLALKRAARLNIQKDKYVSMKMENNDRLMELSKMYAKKMNMKPYYLYRQKNMAGNQENVGYSRAGKEGIYNILMMGDKQDIVAIGAGATTKVMSEDKLNATRIDNVKNVDLYIERIDEMIQRKKDFFDNP